MLKIVLDNRQEIDLGDKSKITIKLNNPVFSDELTYSFPLSIPRNEVNDEILFYRHDIGSTLITSEEENCSIVHDALKLKGLIKFLPSSDKSYNSFYKSSMARFVEWSKETYLNEIELGSYDMGSTNSEIITTCVNALTNYATYGFTLFPIKNTSFWNDWPITFSTGRINNYNGSTFLNTEGNIIIPFLMLNTILRNVYKAYNLELLDTIFDTDADLSTLVIVNFNTITNFSFSTTGDTASITGITKGTQTTLTVDYAAGFESEGFCKITGVSGMTELNNKNFRYERTDLYTIVLDVDSTDFTTYTSGGTVSELQIDQDLNGDFQFNEHVPEITIDAFISAIETHFNVRFVVNEGEQTVTCIDLNEYVETGLIEDISELAANEHEGEDAIVSGYKFISTPDSNDSYYSDYVQELPEEYTLCAAVADFASLPTSGNSNNDVRYVTDEKAYYIYNDNFLNSENGWSFYTYDVALEYTSGDEEYEVTSQIGPFVCKNESGYIYPYNGNAVNSSTFSYLDKADFSLRLLFFRDPFGFQICGVFDSTYGSLSLDFNGTNGIVNQRFTKWLYWYENRRKFIKKQITWTPGLLQNFRYDKKYRIDGITYFVKTIPITLSENEIKFGPTELIRV